MGTFHEDMGPLHGITVVVDTAGPRLAVGRCHQITDEFVHLVGADVHDEGAKGVTKGDYLSRVARVGHWERHPRLSLPRAEVVSIRPLGEL